MVELPKQYDPSEYETSIYQQWEKSGAFAPNEEGLKEGRKPFVIMIPPPNITGVLHMGHALQDSIMDTLIRFHRMLGDPTLWVPGTDHAALPTNALIEKQLRAEGLTRQEIGREKFMERVQAWYQQYGNAIVGQIKRLGCSCDWSRFAFTMDEDYIRAVQEAFIRYYQKGYVYRGTRLVNWCPHCASVISDLEVIHADKKTQLVTLRYQLAGENGYIDVATVRPETMLGDTAVAVNPSDERYQGLIGKMVLLPITKREVPIIADEGVDQNFGTGAVKVTPAHDQFDNDLAQKYDLPAINIIGENGLLTQQAGEFAGLSTTQARQKVTEKLMELGAIVKEEDYSHAASLCARCQTTIEPLLSKQWFVKMEPLKEQTRQVVEEGLVNFHGSRWKKHLLDWVSNEHDWTISRQIWLGQQIPVWWKPGVRGTDKESEPGNLIASIEKPEGEWEQDSDVLDTWFSSALWPLVTLNWPQASEDLRKYYPTSVLVTARDILYLWVHRMIFSGTELLQGEEYGKAALSDRVPFRDVLIHPTVLAKSGQRMSKSLGTGIDPLGLIGTYGADATRFGLLMQMAYDKQAIKFDEDGIKSARNFTNKLWNLARLLSSLPEREAESVADDWIRERLAQVTQQIADDLQGYKLGEAAHTLYEFVWNEFADWYVEILKTEGSTKVASEVFLAVLKLTHPFMPFVTETLWQKLGQSGLLITTPWPVSNTSTGTFALSDVAYFQDVVRTIRSARTLLQLPPAAVLALQIARVPVLIDSLQALTKTKLVGQSGSDMKKFPLSAGGAVALGGAVITSDSITLAKARLVGEQGKLKQLIDQQTKTLEQMKGKAPAGRIAEKEKVIVDSQARQEEISHSLELLTL